MKNKVTKKTASLRALEIITVGQPSIDDLSGAEANAFYSSLAQMAMEYYKAKEQSEVINIADTG